MAVTADKTLPLRTNRDVSMLWLIFQCGLLPTDNISSMYEFTDQEFFFFQTYSFHFQWNFGFVVSLEGYKLITRHGSMAGLSVEIIVTAKNCKMSLWQLIALSHQADLRTSSKTQIKSVWRRVLSSTGRMMVVRQWCSIYRFVCDRILNVRLSKFWETVHS